ncbi:MAG: transcription elongation factor GreA [Candidatus Promineifilaceae bacterium]
MNEDNVVYLTPAGLEAIKEELAFLKNEKRAQLSERLRTAIAMGDLSENADYHTAKEDQAFMEGRIRDLEDTLRRARIIDATGPSEKVQVGSRVTIKEDGYDDEETYHIVGVHEADPAKGRISNESPFGRALLGARIGQTVRVDSPTGILSLKVLRIF